MIITGVSSGAKLALPINIAQTGASGRQLAKDTDGIYKDYYPYVLDDITTAGQHFCDLQSANSKQFIAGEDIKVEAVAYTNAYLANLGYSKPKAANSLYDSVSTGTNGTTAVISSMRHLENLEEDVSHTGYEKGEASQTKRKITINFAKQTKDLDLANLEEVATKDGGKFYVHSYNTSQ